MEGNVLIPSENWVKMCQLQWTIKVSNTWREFGWRHLVRYFITPIQKRHRGGRDLCWRLCGTSGAKHYHIFWGCNVILVLYV